MTSNATPPAGGEESSWSKPPLPGERPHEGEPIEPQRPPPRSETLEAELGALEATLPDESPDTKDHPDYH